MADCECLTRCIFFNDKMAGRPATSELMKRQFCTGDWAACARYQVFKVKGGAAVPADLFPNQVERVKALLGPG